MFSVDKDKISQQTQADIFIFYIQYREISYYCFNMEGSG